MADTPVYRDIRSAFWERGFAEAHDYDRYLALSPSEKAERWRQAAPRLPPLTEGERERLRGHPPLVKLLLVSGVWCGDCVRQGPMLKQIVDACEGAVELRVIDRDVNEALRDEVRLVGARRVPVAIFLSEEFFEVGRFGDRMLVTYRRKARTELGPACPVSYGDLPADELAAEQAEWVDIFERILLMVRLSPLVLERLRTGTTPAHGQGG